MYFAGRLKAANSVEHEAILAKELEDGLR